MKKKIVIWKVVDFCHFNIFGEITPKLLMMLKKSVQLHDNYSEMIWFNNINNLIRLVLLFFSTKYIFSYFYLFIIYLNNC